MMLYRYIFLLFLLFQISFSQTYSWILAGEIPESNINYPFCFFIDSVDNMMVYNFYFSNYNRSTNQGQTWQQINYPTNPNFLTGLSFSGDTIGKGLTTTRWTIYRHSGTTTNLSPLLFFENLQGFINTEYLNRSIVIGDSGKIFHSCSLGLIYSNDSCYTWFPIDIYGQRNYSIAQIIYNDTDNYYFFQTASIVVDSFKNIMSSTKRGIFYSTNNGNTWTQQNFGLSDTSVKSLDVDSHNNIYAVTASGKIFKGTVSMNPAPVELVSFLSSVEGENVTLFWKTATEINSAGFEIERFSAESDNQWKKIGFVSGAGNSNSPNSYSFIDRLKSEGAFRYRLKQIDRDGQFKYSNELDISIIPRKFSLSQNYPNPFNPSTTIVFSIPTAEYVSLNVFDVLGKVVVSPINELMSAGTFVKEYSFKELPSGMYVYRLCAGKFVDEKRMILIK